MIKKFLALVMVLSVIGGIVVGCAPPAAEGGDAAATPAPEAKAPEAAPE